MQARSGTAVEVSFGSAYAVQVASQRSAAEARASFRALRAKFPNQLGGREPMVRRTDLGAKGIYYRAMVGPFASMEKAAGMCRTNCRVQLPRPKKLGGALTIGPATRRFPPSRSGISGATERAA
jgi:hypothetical protein